ncbi:thiol-disulfide oxidoreductase [Phycisphaerae bacterium RAS1]|nr:thiol-disulfide oxidoreductase [Phycisphaerae bacterium RAS1]
MPHSPQLALALVLLPGVLSLATPCSAQTSPVSIGSTAPPIALNSINNRLVSFPDGYRGKIVLISFWAPGFPNCDVESKVQVDAVQAYQARGFDVLGVVVKHKQPPQQQQLTDYCAAQRITWENVYDANGGIGQKYGVVLQAAALPALFLVDADTQQVLAVHTDLQGARLKPTIEKHVKKSGASSSRPRSALTGELLSILVAVSAGVCAAARWALRTRQ